MTPFLKQVVNVYLKNERENLRDYCFVLPNKRSAVFLRNYFYKQLHKGYIMPEITTITDFVASFSDLLEANRIESLFTLFNEYRRQPNVDVDFNSFVFWGDMLINDFNDVDRNLADARQIFTNISRLREIRTNYLTKEQANVIKRYWGVSVQYSDPDHMWSHLDYDDKEADKGKFARLWSVLLPLYEGYVARLKDKGLTTQGLLYRTAAERLNPDQDTDLPFKRYIFVGFNVLNGAEHEIFRRLGQRKCADYYWDFYSPIAQIDNNRAGQFISKNIKEFPSRYPLAENDPDYFPNIEILAVPSKIGQAKMAGDQLLQWINDSAIKDVSNAINTAVVLPDETMLIPLIHSLPQQFDNPTETDSKEELKKTNRINVTMGFPMRNSPIVSIMKNIVSLQLRSRRIREADDSISYFIEDVEALLTTPGIAAANPKAVERLWLNIENRRLFNVPSKMITEAVPELAPVFAPIVDDTDIHQVVKYLRELCQFMKNSIPKDEEMQRFFINKYIAAVNDLYEAALTFHINMNQESFFRLIERAINSEVINFFGAPLRGLQIMGVLETRALDFENVIVLSMNERVFPRKHYTRSFIPNELRRAHGLPSIDSQESIFSYYFYRLISRAKNVTLIYDSRKTGGVKGNGLSRYAAQLLYLFGHRGIVHRSMTYPQYSPTNDAIVINKNERIMKQLEQFKKGGDKFLSASSINQYINCPLNFYLERVEGYTAPDEVYDFIDASTYGKIIHNTAQKFYDDMCANVSNTITREMLEPYTKDTDLTIQRLVTREVNEIFHHLPDNKLDNPLDGQYKLLGKIMTKTFRKVLEKDMEYAPFTYIGGEIKDTGELKISDELTINFKQYIDRIDEKEIEGDTILRFIDYKTGDDSLSAKNLVEMFTSGKEKRPKAILQLLLYCHFYRLMHPDVEGKTLKPLIYPLKTIFKDGIPNLKINKAEVEDFSEYEDEFMELLRAKVQEIFDADIPFTQAPDNHACTFCNFRPICNRELKEIY